jgi:hypothetical protein
VCQLAVHLFERFGSSYVLAAQYTQGSFALSGVGYPNSQKLVEVALPVFGAQLSGTVIPIT